MRRALLAIGFFAIAIGWAATLVGASPASGFQRTVVAPSPAVSVTTLPQLPTVAPAQPTYAPTATTVPAAPSVVAPPGTVIQIVGDVANPKVITLKDLQQLRRSSVTLNVVDPDGKRHVHIYTGVLLRDLIASVAPTGPGGATDSTKAYAVVQGINGDSAIVAFPEFETAFNDKQVLVAYMIDGAPLPGQNIGSLVVPEDQTQGRFISGISAIRIGSPTP